MTYGCLHLLASNNFAIKFSSHIEEFLKNILTTMQNLIIVTKCNAKRQNPNWIHVDMTLAIHRATWIISIVPCPRREHLGLLGQKLDRGQQPNYYKG
jgi:hypothetical protein